MESDLNKDINICFLSGQIISEPVFNFFYNSKKFLSKVSFMLETESGFSSSRQQKSILIKIIAYNEKADLIYRNFKNNDKIQFQGFLQGNEIVLTNLQN